MSILVEPNTNPKENETMSLHLKPVAETALIAAPKLVRLSSDWLPKVREYAAAVAAKKEAEKAARNADNVIKSLRAAIVGAMEGQPSAVCEHCVLTAKTTSDAAASLTLSDGSTVKWEMVSGLTIGNRYIAREDIKSIYGGRSGSLQLDVTGA